MSESNKTSPIFIHSLWRSGSTYLFNVFRRSASGYWCYQEPIHEAALFHQDNPEGLLQFQGEAMRALRHPDLDRPYFLELYETHGYWQGVINKSIIYDEYFDTICSETLQRYLSALIEGAKGRPVIQECRTSNRIKAIKEAMGGTHLHLWRNPWDQWWSFKSTLYFDVVVQLAINGPQPPASIERLRKEIDFSEFHDGNISREFEHFDALRPSAADSYLSFYMLWCLGWLEGYRYADATINIDQLTESASYRDSTLAALKKLGIDGLDFGDCQIHRTLYAANEEAFFRTIEERVHGLLLASGMTSADIDIIIKFRREQAPSRQLEMPHDTENNDVLEDAVRAREITIRLETGAHDRIGRQINAHLNREHELTNQLVQVEQKAQQADAEQAKNFADKEARLGGEIASLRREKAEELAQAVQLLAVRERELMEKSEAVRSEMQLLERAWAERERKLQADATVLQEEGSRQAQQHLKALAQLQERQRQEHETLLRTQAQREQEFAQQLLKIQQEAEQTRREHEQSLRTEHAGRESALAARLQETEKELQRLEQRQAEQQKALSQESAQLQERQRQEHETLLRAKAQREQEFTQQLLTVQQETEQARREYEQALRAEHVGRESALAAQLQEKEKELQQLEENHVVQQKALTQELAQLQERQRQEHETLLRTQAQREQEFAQHLLTIQQESEQSRREHEQSLRTEHAGRESALAARLQEREKELQRFEQRQAEQQKALSQELAQLQERQRQEHEALLRTQAQREQEFAQQLLKVQQESEQARREHEQALRTEHAGRESALAAQLQEKKKELQRLEEIHVVQQQVLTEDLAQLQERQRQEHEDLLRVQTQREQEFAQQLLKIQQESEQARREHEQSLRTEHAGRESALAAQLQEKKKELQRLEENHVVQQKALSQELVQLQERQRQVHEGLLRTQTQREQEVAQQLLKMQQEAEQTRYEHEQSLCAEHAESVAALADQLREKEKELQQLEERLAAQQKTQSQELAQLQEQQHQEHEVLLRAQTQREQEFAQQLLKVQQEAEKSRREHEQILRSEHAERETILSSQLREKGKNLRRLEQSWFEQQKALSKELSQLKEQQHKEHNALLRAQVQREQAFAQQLLKIQQEAEQARREQEQALRTEHVGREAVLATQLQAKEKELHQLEENQAQREQAFVQQLLKVQQEAEQTRREHEQALRAEHTGREAVLTEQLHADQQEFRRLEQEWATHEKGLDKEIAGLRSEIQSLQEAQQLLAQQHEFELTTRAAERNRLIQASAELEARLNGQIQAELQTSIQLRQALAEFQQTLAMTHASFSWRMTAPLRKLAVLFSPPTEYDSSPTMAELATFPPDEQAGAPLVEANSPPAIMPTVAVSQPVTIQQTPMELIMPSPDTATVATTLNELLFLHDQAFIHCAYLTLLGRAADPEGFQYYLGRLRQGASKIQILGQLRSSAEGKARACNLSGLDAAIRRYQRAQNPLIGWLVRLFYVVDGNSESACKLRRIENQLLILSDESNRRFNQMEAALTGLHHLVVQQTQTIVAAMGSARLDTPDVSAITLIKQPEPDGLKHLSSRARDIYFQLKSAAAIHAGRAA